MLLHLHEQNKRTWASSVCYVLYNFGDVWVNQGVRGEKVFLKEFKKTVLSLYRQEWDNSLRTKERFTFYSTFKSFLSLAPYLNELKHIKARNLLIKLRFGVSPLRTHKLLYCKAVDHSCPFCKSDVETEVHFILVCPKYVEMREQYIRKNYFTSPFRLKLTPLLATSKVLAAYIMKAFTIRNAEISHTARCCMYMCTYGFCMHACLYMYTSRIHLVGSDIDIEMGPRPKQ